MRSSFNCKVMISLWHPLLFQLAAIRRWLINREPRCFNRVNQPWMMRERYCSETRWRASIRLRHLIILFSEMISGTTYRPQCIRRLTRAQHRLSSRNSSNWWNQSFHMNGRTFTGSFPSKTRIRVGSLYLANLKMLPASLGYSWQERNWRNLNNSTGKASLLRQVLASSKWVLTWVYITLHLISWRLL